MSTKDDLILIAIGISIPILARIFNLRLVGRAALFPIVLVIGGCLDLISKAF